MTTSSPPAGRDLRAGLVTMLAVAALGLPVGLLWGWLAPREDVLLAPGGAVAFAGAGGDLFVAADLLFVLLAVVAGAVAGAVAYSRAADRGWPVVVGLAVGGLLATLVAVRLGEALGHGALVYVRGQLQPADGRPLPPDAEGVLQVALRLRATAAVVLLPLSAVLAHAVGQLLRPREETEPTWTAGSGVPLGEGPAEGRSPAAAPGVS